MKFGLMVTGLLSACLSLSAVATTLKLSPDIDLLVVDGKKMTGSLLKGADSLELDGGQHQLLFQVTRLLTDGSHPQALYTSPPLIVAFSTQNVSAVEFQLPRIDNQRDGQRFEKLHNYQVVDNNGKPLVIKKDVLRLDEQISDERLEKTVADYNAQRRPASVPAFVHLRTSKQALPAAQSVPQQLAPLKESDVSERMLHYWFQQADGETQRRFLQWANQHAN
ncbi:TPA: DUF2057 family protein [Serratia odorifera]|nr:DUF2057 family protein [Serratia odorifera]